MKNKILSNKSHWKRWYRHKN